MASKTFGGILISWGVLFGAASFILPVLNVEISEREIRLLYLMIEDPELLKLVFQEPLDGLLFIFEQAVKILLFGLEGIVEKVGNWWIIMLVGGIILKAADF